MNNYYIFTLGCQMNESDSQRIASLLNSIGLKPVSEKEAGLIIINACSVRQTAVDRIYGKLKLWQAAKPKKITVLTGCILPADVKKLAPKVDLIFNIKDLPKFPKMLSEILSQNCPTKYLPATSHSLQTKTTLIPIMTGCNHFCTYCAVPYVRGREFSRPEKEILKDAEKAAKKGTTEIILLGQNVNRYKLKSKNEKGKTTTKKSKTPFVKLLRKLIKIPGKFKIKFISPNPWDLPDELINLIAKESKIEKELHLPVQSGDDQILHKMNRPYKTSQYLKLVKKIKTKIPKIWLSTDIIVGFPGETKKAFQNTVKLAEKAKFNKAYISQYSPRPGTKAAQLKDNVPRKEKKRRWKILDKIINSKK